MTENPTNSSKVEEKNSSSTADDAGEDLLSLENLDAVIDKDDPEFNKNISDIAPVGDADELNLDLIDIDQIMADEQSKSIKGRIKKIFKRIRKNLILFYTSFVALMI